MGGAVYELEEIGCRYGEAWVLTGVDLSVSENEFVGVIGPNGSGKSTLLKALAGLLAPRTGMIRLMGRPLSAWRPREMARRVAVVPQESTFVYPFRVLEVVLMGRWVHTGPFGFETAADLEMAERSLAWMELESAAERSVLSLSGGERQRAVIARAFAQEPAILLMDEPTAFLDFRHQLQLFAILRRLRLGRGLTVVMASHDLNLAAQFCDRLVLLRQGRIYQAGPPEQVLTPDHLAAVYECETRVDAHPVTGRPRVTLMPIEG